MLALSVNINDMLRIQNRGIFLPIPSFKEIEELLQWLPGMGRRLVTVLGFRCAVPAHFNPDP